MKDVTCTKNNIHKEDSLIKLNFHKFIFISINLKSYGKNHIQIEEEMCEL